MGTISFAYRLICFAFVGCSWLSGGHLLAQPVSPDQNRLLKIAKQQIGVRELTGRNDGTQVELYLQTVGLKKGQPWCAAFVSWVFLTAGYSQPRTGWSPALFPAKRLRSRPLPGHVYGIYIPELNRIAHCGITERTQHDWVVGIEGNTNRDGNREGDGVYTKWRHRRGIKAFANWLPEKQYAKPWWGWTD